MAFAVVESQSIQNTAPRRIYFKCFGLFRREHFARERGREVRIPLSKLHEILTQKTQYKKEIYFRDVSSSNPHLSSVLT